MQVLTAGDGPVRTHLTRNSLQGRGGLASRPPESVHSSGESQKPNGDRSLRRPIGLLLGAGGNGRPQAVYAAWGAGRPASSIGSISQVRGARSSGGRSGAPLPMGCAPRLSANDLQHWPHDKLSGR